LFAAFWPQSERKNKMAASKEKLLNWLNDLPNGCTIWIDEGGLALVAEGKGVATHYELGGEINLCGTCGECFPDDPPGILRATYCGTMCPECLSKHCDECEVCAKDFGE